MALSRIGAKANLTELDDETSVQGVQCQLFYDQTRDSLLRSHEWPFAAARAELELLYELTLDDAPTPAAFSAAATLTGATSETTCTVVEAISDTVYIVTEPSDDWTDGEVISDGTNSRDCATDYSESEEYEPDFGFDHQFNLPSDYLRLKLIYNDDTKYTIEGKRLLSNSDEMSIVYIAQITDVTDFGSLFTDLLVNYLALRLAGSLAGAGTSSLALRESIMKEIARLESQARTIDRQEIAYTNDDRWNMARYTSIPPLPGRTTPVAED